jgi:hypothetical protein
LPSTVITYSVLSIVFIGILVLSNVSLTAYNASQIQPSIHSELGHVALLVGAQMVRVYETVRMINSSFASHVYVPRQILGVPYSLTIAGSNTLVATAGTNTFRLALPALQNVEWSGIYRSGTTMIIVTALYNQTTVQVSFHA